MIVRESVANVARQLRHVSIDDAAIARWASQVKPAQIGAEPPELYQYLPADHNKLSNLILLIDALNFCFWSHDPIRIQWRGRAYERFNAMLVSLILAAKSEPRWADPEYWMCVPAAELRGILSGTGHLLLMDERERIVRETGRILLERFDGQFTNAVESVNHRAWPLAVLLMTSFDSFRDVAAHFGQPVFFMKRAQICAIDLAMAYRLHGHQAMEGLEELTAFADYRIPQALRHLEILKLNDGLAERIEKMEEIEAGSAEEVEIRAASVEAVERMVQSLLKHGKRFSAWQVDFHLWDVSHDAGVRVNHHRTRTIFY
jgi:hypothetical protein